MKIVILGASEVGQVIARNLASSHDVTVIDPDPDRLDDLVYSVDVLPIEGDPTDRAVLMEADIDDAEILVGCCDRDEKTLVACETADTITDTFTVANVQRRNILNTWEHSDNAFGVNLMVCTDLLTAQTIFRLAGLPAAHDFDSFASGLIRMAEFEITDESPVANQTVKDSDQFESLTYAGIFREGEFFIPRGQDKIKPGDRLIVVGSPQSVQTFSSQFQTDREEAREIVIAGGGHLGEQVAELFQNQQFQTRLIERDPDRARRLAEDLPDTLVLQEDATKKSFLLQENIDECDLFVTTLDSEERNLLAALLAKKIGVERTVVVSANEEHAEVIEDVGIDIAINPREETIEEVLRYTRPGQTEKVSMVEHDRAELIELRVDSSNQFANETILDTFSSLSGVVVGAITRSGTVITPRGDTVLKPGDHVVFLVDTETLPNFNDLL